MRAHRFLPAASLLLLLCATPLHATSGNGTVTFALFFGDFILTVTDPDGIQFISVRDNTGAVEVNKVLECPVTFPLDLGAWAVHSVHAHSVSYMDCETEPHIDTYYMGVGSDGVLVGTTAVPSEWNGGTLPSLKPLYPNPFYSETRIRFDLPKATAVRLEVFTVDGRRVRMLIDGARSAGPGEVTWNGRDDRGARLSPGVYVVRLVAGPTTLMRKVSLRR